MAKKSKWIICPVCLGEGSTVDPAIDCHGISAEEFREDPDFAEEYFAGTYDVVCAGCEGLRVVAPERVQELEDNAQTRRLAAREDGDFETFRGAADWRWG